MSFPGMTFMGSTGTMTGDQVRVDGFPGPVRTRHVVSVSVSNFKGSVILEGTLVCAPTDADWFEIRSETLDVTGQQTIAWAFDSRTIWLRVRDDAVERGYVRRVLVR